MVLEKILESPFDSREIKPVNPKRSSQSVLKEINPDYSLEVLMLKLKLQYFGHLMRRANSLEKTMKLGKTEGNRRRGRQRVRWLGGIINSKYTSVSKLREMVKDREAWRPAARRVTESNATEQLNTNSGRSGSERRA